MWDPEISKGRLDLNLNGRSMLKEMEWEVGKRTLAFK